jgi:MFS family permease
MFLRGTVLNSMLPLYVGVELGYSATRVGTLFGVAGLVSTLMIFPSGFISDRFGRKAATVPAAALTGVSFVMFTAADTMPMLMTAAAVQGLSTGFALGSLTTSTFDIAPTGEAARFQSLRRFAAELGTLTGPALAGAVAGIYSSRMVFLFFAPIYLISASLLAFVSRETHPSLRKGPYVPDTTK